MTRALFILILIAASGVMAEETAAPWGLEQLMQQRAHIQRERSRFVDVRKLPATQSTTTSSGVLIYEAPDHLERLTSKPYSEHAVVQGERLALETGAASGKGNIQRREFALTDLPGLRPFFVALRSLLAGDLSTLERDFSVALNGNEDSWRLTLTPRAQADRHLLKIVISGKGVQILTIEVRERNGDSSRTTLTPQTLEPMSSPETPAEPPPAPASTTSSP